MILLLVILLIIPSVCNSRQTLEIDRIQVEYPDYLPVTSKKVCIIANEIYKEIEDICGIKISFDVKLVLMKIFTDQKAGIQINTDPSMFKRQSNRIVYTYPLYYLPYDYENRTGKKEEYDYIRESNTFSAQIYYYFPRNIVFWILSLPNETTELKDAPELKELRSKNHCGILDYKARFIKEGISEYIACSILKKHREDLYLVVKKEIEKETKYDRGEVNLLNWSYPSINESLKDKSEIENNPKYIKKTREIFEELTEEYPKIIKETIREIMDNPKSKTEPEEIYKIISKIIKKDFKNWVQEKL